MPVPPIPVPMRDTSQAPEPGKAAPAGKGGARSQRRDWSQKVEAVHARVLLLRQVVMEYATRFSGRLKYVQPAHLGSAQNLLHYMCMRRQDLRPLQEQLAELGLSSLGRSESHVLSTVDAVSSMLAAAASRPRQTAPDLQEVAGYRDSQTLAARNEVELLGRLPKHRHVRIMVTLPSEAAEDYEMMRDLVANGMDCVRINCAHDDAAVWQRMLHQLRRAEDEVGRTCRVLMDLGGPKLRTGPLVPGPKVVKWRPQRNRVGKVVAPAKIWLFPTWPGEVPPEKVDAEIPLGEAQARLKVGQELEFRDARGSKRRLTIARVGKGGCLATSDQTAYVLPGTVLSLGGKADAAPGEDKLPLHVGDLPAVEEPLLLQRDDILVLTLPDIPGAPAVRDAEGQVTTPAHIGCTLPEVFADLREGERVMFDDGKIGAKVTAVQPLEVQVRITNARDEGERLGSEKGINLPDSRLHVSALTPKDLEDLVFVAQHADMVGCSFVRSSRDIRALQRNLARVGGQRLGLVLKIETQQAFDQLPNLLLTALGSHVVGVMIARGDLAIECGFERMAELQEEILWLCEAAHVPVIWATQVLDTLAKKGFPSRAEITDAAMAVRAECVMLNKGPFINRTIRVLDDILKRMQDHQSKKKTMLRKLGLAERFTDSPKSDSSPTDLPQAESPEPAAEEQKSPPPQTH